MRISDLIKWLRRPRSQPVYTGEQPAIERYSDYRLIGSWACLDTKTGVTTRGGDMLSRTVKFSDGDGVHLGTDWVPDERRTH